MPATPAKSTHGLLVKMSPPLASCACVEYNLVSAFLGFKRCERMGWVCMHTEIEPLLHDNGKVGLCETTVVG